MESQENKIEALKSIGINVIPVMKAFVPQNIGDVQIRRIGMKEMDIDEAYKKYCLSPLRNYDPFA